VADVSLPPKVPMFSVALSEPELARVMPLIELVSLVKLPSASPHGRLKPVMVSVTVLVDVSITEIEFPK